MEVILTDGNDERFVALYGELDNYLNSIIGREKQVKQYNKYNALTGINDVVLVIENGKAVACGSFKELDSGIAEIKRVFTKENYRNRSCGKTVLQALEKRALDKRYNKLILETGRAFAEAIGMYTSAGYNIIDNYGQYKNISDSICMEKIFASQTDKQI